MLQFAAQPTSKNGLPRRTSSLSVAASKAPIFIEIEEELHDIRRVHMHGQEDDLRYGMTRMISRVEQLSTLLKDAYKAQTDIQNELTLAKSNLQLALANNEMLEDALNRDVPGSSKDVGWRRWGPKEQKEREQHGDSRRQSTDSTRSMSMDAVPSPSMPSPVPSSDSKFFRFRFGGGSTSTNSATASSFPSSPRIPMSPALNGHPPQHLTSASLPSLIPENSVHEEELAKLSTELEKERKALKEATSAKEALEAELESLSQALFEEANNMVATERRKLAETEEELKEARAEKEALRSALRLVESQRGTPTGSETNSPDFAQSLSLSHSRNFSASSAIAIKSPPSSSPISSPRSSNFSIPEQPLSARTIVPNSESNSTVTASPDPSHSPNSRLSPSPSPSPSPTPEGTKTPSAESKGKSQGGHKINLIPPTPDSADATPSPRPSPSPEGRPMSIQPISYDDEGSSPWADVRSASNTPRVSAEV